MGSKWSERDVGSQEGEANDWLSGKESACQCLTEDILGGILWDRGSRLL